jgi:hypothetical protein
MAGVEFSVATMGWAGQLRLHLDRAPWSKSKVLRVAAASLLALAPWSVVVLRPAWMVRLHLGLAGIVAPGIAALALTAVGSLAVQRPTPRKGLAVVVSMSRVQWLIVLVVAAFLVPFIGHLFADQLACARGVTSAC